MACACHRLGRCSKVSDDNRGTYGDGSIRTRKDGRLEKRVRLGVDPRTGKYVRKSVYGKNLREVQARARAAIAEYRAGQQAAAGTLGEFVDGHHGWFDLKAREVGARALHNYQRDYERYIGPHLGDAKLEPDALTVEQVTRWHAGLAKQHGAYTANRARNLLANILADTPGLRLHNPAKVVRAAKHQKPPIEIFTAGELERFLPAASRTRLRNMFLLALTAGLRHSEAAAAVRDQRELLGIEGLGDSRLVFPSATGSLQPNENTNRVLRGVIDACNPRLMERVYELRAQHRDAGASMHKARQLAHVEVQALPEYPELLDVKYLSFHDLRHTFASMMIAAGMSAPRLALVLRHSDPAFTMRTYVHFFERRTREAMPRVSLLVPGFAAIGSQIGGHDQPGVTEDE